MSDRRPPYDAAIMRSAAKAGQPTEQHDLSPKTRRVPVSTIRPGDVVMQSDEHPVRVSMRKHTQGRELTLYCRYVWQNESEPVWTLGTFRPTALIEKAVKR